MTSVTTPAEFRKKIASGEFNAPTAGYCDGFVQANMLVLPGKYAGHFEEFARANAAPVPVLETVRGGYHTSVLADGANLLNELPSYDIFENGERVARVPDMEKYYTEDMVFFLIGCSFSFEARMVQEGIPLRHMAQKINVAMYDTSLPLTPVDIFHGNMVVSMRPIRRDLVAKACVVTSHFPKTHGMPVQVGYPEMIGIKDIARPDYGDPVEIKADEIPVFWACGVTPQNVLRSIKIPFAITHSPGNMFVSDRKDSDYYE
jgi:uncharacterized protein YcsI (UPF0317 family)